MRNIIERNWSNGEYMIDILKTWGKVVFWTVIFSVFFSAMTMRVYREWGAIGIEGLSVVASAVLTAFLVLLYFKQVQIADQQYQLMELGRRANIVFDNQIIANGDRLEFKIRNTGEGVAHSIYLKTKISADTEMFLDPSEYQLREINGDNKKTTLEPLSDTYNFQGRVGGIIKTNDRKSLAGFEQISTRLAENNVEKCEIDISVIVNDLAGSYDFQLWKDEIEIENGEPFEKTLPAKLVGMVVRKDVSEEYEDIVNRI